MAGQIMSEISPSLFLVRTARGVWKRHLDQLKSDETKPDLDSNSDADSTSSIADQTEDNAICHPLYLECSDCAVLGLALFHRCAFATWSGTFLSVDCLKVRSGCRRRGIGRALAVEMIRIAAKSASPLVGWVAKEDAATDFFPISF
ncbi:hypothetical protein niasHS_008538 [Heterodera schachtii]|uniref:N-acetyltransferase domain-containing protein n=1 Tax=Heterodera schachtii TaxID=97005 RepID=A0ABD2JEM1_HETSC